MLQHKKMAEAILLAVAKIGAVILNEAISGVMLKLSMKVDSLKALPTKIKKIEKELRSMNDVIQDLGTTHLSNNVIKGWVSIVRKLAYHVEDVIDKYSYEALKLKEEPWYILSSSSHVKVFSKIADEVAEIEEEIKYVDKERSNIWNNLGQPIKNEHTNIDRKRSGGCFPERVSDKDLVGIEENRRKLTEWLMPSEQESMVIAVSGMGGLGKTTLVKNVYDREKANFPDAHAWIVVSQGFDVVDLLGTLLTKIRQHTEQSSSPPPYATVGDKADVYELTEAIKKILQDRRFLVVLDDVWDKQAYNQMSNAFQGLPGSRVIITTRKEDVAALATQSRRLILEPLPTSESFKLFCSRAFLNHECPPELETVAAAVVKRCRGLPLCIVSSGSLLSTKQPTEHVWNQMYNHLQSELRDNNHVQAILNLSYHDMPGDLRNCLLYCSMFPEDYPMSRETLVRLWVAEGFVAQKDDSTAEEVAEGNLMELIGRNMLEVAEWDELSRVNTCKMHDIIRDLALAVAKEERFGCANDQGKMMHMDTEVRRLSTCGWPGGDTAAARVEFPRLRTVISLSAAFSSTSLISSVLTGSNYLTVLELQDSGISEVPASIGNLFNLRYIGLRRTKVQSLPETVRKLSNLQTLDIKQTKIVKLPQGIVKAEKLRHLLADRFADENQTEFRYFIGVEAPKMISNLHELQTLETVHASKDLSQQLKKMHKLQTLWIDNINASNCEDLFHTLSSMPILSSLLLCACDETVVLSFQALKPIFKTLHRLIIRGGWAHGTLNCPIFQGHGKNLKYLALSWCDLEKEDPLQLLASHMPDLTYLSLNTVRSAGILILSEGSFPQLKTLVLKRMPNVEELVVVQGAIPCIDGIYIVSLLRMSTAPHGIESLGSLRKLWLLKLHKDFKADWIQNQMNNKMKHVTELRT
ncbi:unnamed protein product [Alopecurus aequalis]